MSIAVSISLFFGRTNPHFDLSKEQERELASRLEGLRSGGDRWPTDALPFGIGTIRVTRKKDKETRVLFTAGGGVIAFPGLPRPFPDTGGVGAFLLEICPEPLLPIPTRGVLIDLWKLRHVAKKGVRTKCSYNVTADAVAFDPDWATGLSPNLGGQWNRQPCNNCYDYANQQITSTFSQPGLGGGQIFDTCDCASITAAAIRDGLVPVPHAKDPLGPGQGWYVALVVGTAVRGAGSIPDYHWLKQDKSGCWSHKPGEALPTDRDVNGKQIRTPDSAAFDKAGSWKYDTFCGYFRTTAGVTILGYDLPSWCPEVTW
jgi:hypothetical protein